MSKKQNKPYGSDRHNYELVEAIKEIDNIELLPVLAYGVKVEFGSDFEDNRIHTLYNALYQCFISCARKDSQGVLEQLISLKNEEGCDLEQIAFCNSIINIISELENEKNKQKWNIRLIKPFLKELDGI